MIRARPAFSLVVMVVSAEGIARGAPKQFYSCSAHVLPMSNKPLARVRKTDAADPADPRVRRSVYALGGALVALMHERAFHEITVQDILDRAGVGRATFYSHYRNKDDVLHSSYERFFGWCEQLLESDAPHAGRLFPVAEFLAHISGAGAYIEALRASGKLEELYSLGLDFVARIIERRMGPATGNSSAVPRALQARMLAAALMEMTKWWLDRPASSSPQQMDATFHALARVRIAPGAAVASRSAQYLDSR